MLKLRSRWRDTHRDAKSVRSSKEAWEQTTAPVASKTAPPPKPISAKAKAKANGAAKAVKPKIYHVNYREDSKPMSLEEAIMVMDSNVNYFVYRDAGKDCMSVLVRRSDGNLDLIES